MKKGLFTAAVIAAMMMTQPVMAQEVVGQTEEIVAQTEETEQEDVPESPESDMAEEYEGTSDSQVRLTVFSGENNEMPIVSADPTDKEVQQPEKKIGWQTEEGKTYYYDENGNLKSIVKKTAFASKNEALLWIAKYDYSGTNISVFDATSGDWDTYIVGSDGNLNKIVKADDVVETLENVWIDGGSAPEV